MKITTSNVTLKQLEDAYDRTLKEFKRQHIKKERLRKLIFAKMGDEPGNMFAYEVYRVRRKGRIDMYRLLADHLHISEDDAYSLMEEYRRPGKSYLGIRLRQGDYHE